MAYPVDMPGPLADLQDQLGEVYFDVQRFGRVDVYADAVEDMLAAMLDQALAEDEHLDAQREASDSVRADMHANTRRLVVLNHGRRLRWATRTENRYIGSEHTEITFNRLTAQAVAAGRGPCEANLIAYRALLTLLAEPSPAEAA